MFSLTTVTALMADADGHMEMSWNGWGWTWLVGVAFVVLGVVIGLVVVALTRDGRRPSPGPDPRSILAERYARGELSTEEYHERLDGLR